MTLSVAKVPQVYLYGTIDADAAHRFEALMRSGKIPGGSDVYLNTTGGDTAAGLALGRLFRSGSMVTHVGVRRRMSRTEVLPTLATCVDACAYAYMGGLFRWAPTGIDRFGVQAIDGAGQTSPKQSEIAAYVKDMGVDPRWFTPAQGVPHGTVTWLSAERMLAMGLANNGRLPPTATMQMMSGAPYLTLSQLARDGERRITLLCRPDGLTLTAYYTIGVERAKRVVERASRSYFEVDYSQTLQENREGVTAANQSIVITRPVPLTKLTYLLSGRSVGAWLADKGGAVRYGFTIDLDSMRKNLTDYSTHCEQIAKLPNAPKAP